MSSIVNGRILIAGTVVCACMCGCFGGAVEVSEISKSNEIDESSSSFTSLVLVQKNTDNMRTYAKLFASVYAFPFSSVNELDYGKIGYNSLFFIVGKFGEAYFETNENGYFYIPKNILQAYVQEHFGIENYEYPVSEIPNILPQYSKEKDAYLFADARGGLNANISVVEENISDETATYVIRFEYKNIENNEIMKVVEIKYIFKIVHTKNGFVLQADSASVI